MKRDLSQNEFDKIKIYSRRMIELMERDGTIEQFRGSTDYLVRTAIEAFGLGLLFYDPVSYAGEDAEDDTPVDSSLDWERARKYLMLVKHRYEGLRNTPGVNPNFALQGVIYPLEKRYVDGERSQDLYDEIIGLE